MIRREVAPNLRGMQAWAYVGVPLAFFTALAQVVVVGEIPILGIKPNLFLLFVVTWVLLGGLRQGLLLAMLGGLFLEINSGASFGCVLVSLAAAVGLAGVSETNLFRGAWFLKYLAILAATLGYEMVYLGVSSVAMARVPWGFALRRVILPEMLVHLALMPLTYGALTWVGSRFRNKPVES